jgi:isoleucyl-tRNA synthetase
VGGRDRGAEDAERARAVAAQFHFAKEEEKVIQYWRDIDAFQTSLKLSEGRPEYSFYDGPPFATGLPHYGHLLAGTIKVCGGRLLTLRLGLNLR